MAKKQLRNKKVIKKQSKRFKRILLIAALLLIAYIVLWIITPSAEEYESTTSGSKIADLELPAPRDSDTIISHTGYRLVYNEEHEQADWVAYELTRAEVMGEIDRMDNFREDPKIASGSATLDDYRSSGYDRGHLIPAADLNWSEQAMSDSFYMSNMSPQEPSFNRGLWSTLEAIVRNLAYTKGSIYVVTGPVLSDGPYKTIGKNNVSVPNYYYKAILYASDDHYDAIGFIVPNERGTKDITAYATSIDVVEQTTELDFFYKLEDDIEDMVESSFHLKNWDLSELRVTTEMRNAFKEAPYQTQTTSAKKNTSPIGAIINNLMVPMKKEIKTFVLSITPSSLKNVVHNIL